MPLTWKILEHYLVANEKNHYINPSVVILTYRVTFLTQMKTIDGKVRQIGESVFSQRNFYIFYSWKTYYGKVICMKFWIINDLFLQFLPSKNWNKINYILQLESILNGHKKIVGMWNNEKIKEIYFIWINFDSSHNFSR